MDFEVSRPHVFNQVLVFVHLTSETVFFVHDQEIVCPEISGLALISCLCGGLIPVIILGFSVISITMLVLSVQIGSQKMSRK